MSQKRPIISLEGITKSYQMGDLQFPVLHGITFNVEAGEFVSVLGPSGSGKSTLMNIIGCLDVPDSGTYTLGRRTVAGLSERAMARVRNHDIGFVFQSFQLLPRISAIENVMLPLIYAKVPRAQRLARAMKELERVGLADKADNLPRQLSGGQQQRVAIARTLMLDPEILCFDEPTSSLDPELTGEVLRVIRSLKSRDRTMIIVTHEMEFARHVSDRVIFISDGVIEESGTPEEIFGNPKSEKMRAFLAASREA